MKLGSHEYSDNKVIRNLLAKFFASSYSPSTLNFNNQINIPEEILLINALFLSI